MIDRPTRILLSLGALVLVVLAGTADARPRGCYSWCYRHGNSPACYRDCDNSVQSTTNKADVVRKGSTAPVRREGVHR